MAKPLNPSARLRARGAALCLSIILALTLNLTLNACTMQPAAYSKPFTAASDIALLSEPGVRPRNINLQAFDPHRPDFTCTHASARLPQMQADLAPQATSWFEQGLTLTSPGLWPNERNYVQAVQLWQQAADAGHWQAAMMLVNTYQTGAGLNSKKGQFYVPAQAPELVIQRLEALMQRNVPDAFYDMGNAYERGYGLPRDIDRAWALWALAADMGSDRAQVRIAKVLNADHDAPEKGYWGNAKVAMHMLECAYEQRNGQAAFKLGLRLDASAQAGNALNGDAQAQFARARQILHNGVKWGSEDCAGYIFSAFALGEPLSGVFIDKERARRYRVFIDALFYNPDLRFPNLDKVLPLPPAKLPPWDGDTQSLIDAAKAVLPKPAPVDVSLRIPEDALRVPAYRSILTTSERWGLNLAPKAGLWLAQPGFDLTSRSGRSPQQSLVAQALHNVPPQAFRAGQIMTVPNPTLLDGPELWMWVQWVYLGETRRVPAAHADILTNWRVHSAQAQAAAVTLTHPPTCAPGHACTHTGTWAARVDAHHRAAAHFNRWDNQTYVRQAQTMPTPPGVGQAAGVEAHDVRYTLVQADPQPHFVGDATDHLAAQREATRQRIRTELGLDDNASGDVDTNTNT